MRIRDLIQYDNERILARCFRLCEDIFHFRIFIFTYLCDHALVLHARSHRIYLFFRHEVDYDSLLSRQSDYLRYGTFRTVSNEYALYIAVARQHFNHRISACNHLETVRPDVRLFLMIIKTEIGQQAVLCAERLIPADSPAASAGDLPSCLTVLHPGSNAALSA